MRNHLLIWIAVLSAIAVAGTYVGWAVVTASKLGDGWAGLGSAWPYLLAGVLTVAAAIAGFLWLARFSQSHGYDDRPEIDRR